jgi:acyl-coenzyme A thioesterase PaaI-like protein
MSNLMELPHTSGCVACSPDNPNSLKLKLFVNPDDGVITVRYVPDTPHFGFDGIVHGGIISTVFDEAMVWAASWNVRAFCFCGELSVRFRKSMSAGQTLLFKAQVETSRPRLITTRSEALDEAGAVYATATAKYIPVSREQHKKFVATFLKDPATQPAADILFAEVK